MNAVETYIYVLLVIVIWIILGIVADVILSRKFNELQQLGWNVPEEAQGIILGLILFAPFLLLFELKDCEIKKKKLLLKNKVLLKRMPKEKMKEKESIVEFIKNLFPFKAKTLNQFIKLVRDGQGSIVKIEPGILRDDMAIRNVGVISDWHYLIDFESKTSKGRKIIYREECFYTIRSMRTQIYEVKERNRMSVQMFLSGEERMKYIKNELPGIQVDLIGPGEKLMGEVLLKKLHTDAKKVGVSLS